MVVYFIKIFEEFITKKSKLFEIIVVKIPQAVWDSKNLFFYIKSN